MKKLYTTPALDVVSFDCNDIVTASGESLEMKGEWSNNTANAKNRSDIWGED
jgi:hypothetical protein